MAQPVEAAAHPLITPSRSGVMAKRAAVHAGANRLHGGEVAGLSLSQAVETVMIYV